MDDNTAPIVDIPWRRVLVVGALMLCATVLVWRSVDLQVYDTEFLKREGRARYLRTISVPAHRGRILDRNGLVLAVSTPVDSVWANPKEVDTSGGEWSALTRSLGLDEERTRAMLRARSGREFVYLKRHLPPEVAARARARAPRGVYLQREYRRYYPAADLAGHLVGFTNVDDRGQEGVELAYEEVLRGVDGREQVLRDRKGHVVEPVRSVRETRAGQDLVLSIDRRVQYFAFRALARAVKRHKARGASAVVLDPVSGEVLAVVNQPSFNPNRRADRVSSRFRNRAVTDLFEPGSTVKPFTVAAALESGRYDMNSTIDTRPGRFKVAGHTVRDIRNYGVVDLVTLIKKSSNVGTTRIALDIEPRQMWQTFHRVGFGNASNSGFPGEVEGVLPHFFDWGTIHRATLSFGYGLSVSVLQLARAYGAVANDGRLAPVTFLRRNDRAPEGPQAMSSSTARKLRHMLEEVTSDGGTGTRARVHGYRVGGKSGTARKPVPGGYAEDRYLSLFAGMAPMSRPQLVIAVVIDEPRGKQYYGGAVAAPVFSEIAAGALRVLGVAPDDPEAAPAAAGKRLARAPEGAPLNARGNAAGATR